MGLCFSKQLKFKSKIPGVGNLRREKSQSTQLQENRLHMSPIIHLPSGYYMQLYPKNETTAVDEDSYESILNEITGIEEFNDLSGYGMLTMSSPDVRIVYTGMIRNGEPYGIGEMVMNYESFRTVLNGEWRDGNFYGTKTTHY